MCHTRLFAALLIVAPLIFGAPSVGNPIASPASIPVNTPTLVTVTTQITSPGLIPGGVNLLQVNATGGSAVILGAMQAGPNGTFILQVTLKQSTAGTIYLEVSAAFTGMLERVLSAITPVSVTSISITDFNPKSGPVGTLVTITGANLQPNTGTAAQVTLSKQGGGTIGGPVSSTAATSLSFVIPDGAATGPPSVTINGASATAAVPLTISPASNFTLSALPASTNLIQGQSAAYSVSLASSNGFDQLATLSVTGVPTGVTATFKPPSITAGQFSVLTLSAPTTQAISTSTLSISIAATVNGLPVTQAVPVTLAVVGPTTTLVGRTVVSDALETPLAGVTITTLGKDGNGNLTGCTGHGATSDGAGNFALTNLPMQCTGPQLIGYDGTTVTSPAGKYAGVNLVYTFSAGQVTTAPVLIHLPRIDNQETFFVQQNAPADQSYSWKTIPNLSVTVYAGTIFTMPDGTHPNPFPLTAIDVPVDRLPDIKPPVPTMITAFIVAFQPANATTNQPVAVYYPNELGTAPGMDMALLTLDPTHGAMVPYGTGAVNFNGTQIVPDSDPAHPGHLYGLVHFDWHMPGYPPGNQLNPCAFSPGVQPGQPVDASCGLDIITETDISFGGSRGTISLVRVYRNGINPQVTTYGPFGYGSNHNFGYELGVVTPSAASVIPLIMPDGNQFPFSKQSDGTFTNSSGIPSMAGAVMRLAGDPGSNTNTVDLRWKDGTIFEFVQMNTGTVFRNLLNSITDPNGNEIQIVHNGFLITDIIDPVGRDLHFNYNTDNKITQITAPDGSFVSYDYGTSIFGSNGNEPIRVVTHPDGSTTHYDYAIATSTPTVGENLTAETDGRGVVIASNTYDLNNRITQQVQANGGVLQFSYTLQNSLPMAAATSPVLATTVTDALGHQTSYRFSPAGALLSATDPLGQTRVFNRDGNNNIVGITGAAACDACGDSGAGDQIFSYDGSANLLSQTDAVGNTTNYTYDPTFNKITLIKDPLGNTTTFTYDAHGNLLTQKDPNGNVTTYEYDQFGELIQATDPLHQTTFFSYDGLGNLVAIRDPLDSVTELAYDINGRLLTTQDALGRKTQIAYDKANRIISQTNAQNGLTSFTYDQVGNLLKVTDARNNTTSFTYNLMNGLLTRTDPLGRSDSRSYDLAENLTQFKDRRGQTSAFTYDAANRLIQEAYQDGITVARSYDANERLAAVTDSASGAFGFSYDQAGRLTSSLTPFGTVQYLRDGLGRATSRQVVGQSPVTYSYDPAGNLSAATMPQASVNFTFNARNQLSSISRLNGVSSAFAYDSAARLLALTHAKGAAVLDTESYGYDAVGNRTSHSTSIGQPLITQAVASAGYDADNEQNQLGPTSNTFDANGNLVSSSAAGATTTYAWDSRNRLKSIVTSAGQTTNFTYDFAGNLLFQSDSGTSLNLTKYFVLDDLTNVAYESATDGSSFSVLSGRSIDSHMAVAQSTGQVQYGLPDAVNSTVVTVDQGGAIKSQFLYDSFGQATTAGSYPFQFTGRVAVSNNLYYYRARFYSPTTGRFISEDPIGFAGGDANLYRYARNSPVAFIDPLGLDPNSSYDLQISSGATTAYQNRFGNAYGGVGRGLLWGIERSVVDTVTDNLLEAVHEGLEHLSPLIPDSLMNKIPGYNPEGVANYFDQQRRKYQCALDPTDPSCQNQPPSSCPPKK